VGRVTPLRKTIRVKQTSAQEKFWKILQEEGNCNLHPQELCRLAGYHTLSPWYDALKDDEFRAQVEALGVRIYRHASPAKCTEVLIPLAENTDEEWLKDVIDIRRLASEYPKHYPASCFKIDFSCVRNVHMRWLVKRYFRARLGFWEPRSFKDALENMKPFFFALGNACPELESFAPLTREMIEPLLTQPRWVDSRGYTRLISTDKKRRMVTSLSTFFSYLQRHEWEGAPTHTLIYEEDRPQHIKKRPRPLPQSVFEQLQTYAHCLEPYARNLVEILSVAGLRAEDALHLPEDCLEYDATGDPRLHWYNHKMKRDGRPLPVTTSVAEAIQRQRELVLDIPDHFGRRYLFRTSMGLYQFRKLCYHLNDLAKKVPILGADQQIYRFKPHAFRHMVGTSMINLIITHKPKSPRRGS
jgi:integrase